MDEYCHAHSGFTQGSQANSNLICKRSGTNTITISGYASLGVNAALQIRLYLQIAPNSLGAQSSSVNIVVSSSTGNTIINANTAALTFTTTVFGSSPLALSNKMTLPYARGSAYPLYITFRLRSNSLVQGDYIQIDFGSWVIDTATVG